MFAAASDVGGGVKDDIYGGGRVPGDMMPWSQAVTLSPGPKPSKKGQDDNVKTRFGENPLTRKKKPLKDLPFLLVIITGHILICALMSHVQHSDPGGLPTRPYNFLSEATVGRGCRSQRVLHSFLRVLLRSLSRIILSLPEPVTVRRLSCPAGPTFHAVVTRLALFMQPDCEQVRRRRGRPSVLGMCGWNATATAAFLRAHQRTGNPGQPFLHNPGKLVVGADPHPLGLHAAKYNRMN